MTLWDFSLSLYDKPGVPDACLTLQNRHNLDVNLVLFCLWLAAESRCLTKNAMQEVIAHSDTWREKMITPLRALRTEMKGWPSDVSISDFSRREDFEALRGKVKAIELEAEKWQQEMLTSYAEHSAGVADPELACFSTSLDLLIARSGDDNPGWKNAVLWIADAHGADFAEKVRIALV
ncbi:MAG: TIGR02444 family protein [Pseudomonadales bacterium]|nr:TIGR02444 family protein [Pseudomonadales bacterium]